GKAMQRDQSCPVEIFRVVDRVGDVVCPVQNLSFDRPRSRFLRLPLSCKVECFFFRAICSVLMLAGGPKPRILQCSAERGPSKIEAVFCHRYPARERRDDSKRLRVAFVALRIVSIAVTRAGTLAAFWACRGG